MITQDIFQPDGSIAFDAPEGTTLQILETTGAGLRKAHRKRELPALFYDNSDCWSAGSLGDILERRNGAWIAPYAAARRGAPVARVYLWLEGGRAYRVVAKAADGTVLATINRVTPEAEFA